MKAWKILFLIFLVIGSFIIISNEAPYQENKGFIFGTYYNISYKYKDNIQEKIEYILRSVDKSLSPFNKQSVITAINNNTSTTTDSLFREVFTLAQDISYKTDGYFDITVAPLVNAWGFGFKNGYRVDSTIVDSLLKHVGYRKVKLKNGNINKEKPEIMLDCSAIAKGFGCDVVAHLLDEMGIEHYMVEIGGEVVAKGKNNKSKPWSIGINKPIEDKSGSNKQLQKILHISGMSLATSGNYRNYRYENGRKLSHTINPKTGYPVEHSLLSATVIANDCATADAYATAFMVMGMEKAIEVCKQNNIDAFFIYSNLNDSIDVYETAGLKNYY